MHMWGLPGDLGDRWFEAIVMGLVHLRLNCKISMAVVFPICFLLSFWRLSTVSMMGLGIDCNLFFVIWQDEITSLLQIEIDVALRYDGNGGGSQTRWDTNKMVHDALHGSNREQLFQVVDRELSKILPMVQCSLPNPDVLWDAVSKSIRTAPGVYVTSTKKMRERPADTTSAIEDMLQAKSDMVQFRPLLLGNRAVQWDGESTLCLQQALHDLFWGWKKISKFHSLRKQVDSRYETTRT